MILNQEELWTPSRVDRPYKKIWIDWRADNLPRTSAGFSTRDRVILAIHTHWGTKGWRAAPQKEIWGFGLMAS